MREEGEQIKEKRVSLKEIESFLADYEQEKSAAIIMGMYWWKNHKAGDYCYTCLLLRRDVHFFQPNTTTLRKCHSLSTSRHPPVRCLPSFGFSLSCVAESRRSHSVRGRMMLFVLEPGFRPHFYSLVTAKKHKPRDLAQLSLRVHPFSSACLEISASTVMAGAEPAFPAVLTGKREKTAL